MALYESVIIIRQDMSFEDVDNLIEKLEKTLSSKGGKVSSKEYWGLRNLAYKIHKSSKAHYVLLNVEADAAAIKEFDRVMSINEDIVRSVIFNKTSDFGKQSNLFLCEKAKDFKPSMFGAQKENKYSDLINNLQFDN